MVDKFLADIFRRIQPKKIGIVIDGGIANQTVIESLPTLVEKLREFGDIKIADAMFEKKLSDSAYEKLSQAGFTNKIVAGNIELNLVLDTYDLVLSESVDILVIGTTNQLLIPLFTEIRKTITTFAFINHESTLPKAFIESFDGVIISNKIDEFSLNQPDYSEIEALMSANTNGSNGNGNGTIITEQPIDNSTTDLMDANIGTMSEVIEDEVYGSDEEMIEDQSTESAAPDEVAPIKEKSQEEVVKVKGKTKAEGKSEDASPKEKSKTKTKTKNKTKKKKSNKGKSSKKSKKSQDKK